MDEELAKQFQEVIAHRQAQDQRAQQAAEQKADQAKSVEFEWKNKREQIIAPALREIETMLKPAGWLTKIQVEQQGEIKFEVYRGNMLAAGQRNRPHVWFNVDIPKREVLTYSATTTSSGGGPRLELATLSQKDVQATALAFFTKLASE